MKLKKVFSIFVLVFVVFISDLYAVTVDVKTHFLEKTKLMAIKIGTIYYLEKSGVKVSEIGEDYTVWLKNLKVEYDGRGWYWYTLNVKISYPSAFEEKETIAEELVKFKFSIEKEYNFYEVGLIDVLKKYYEYITERVRNEAYIGGKQVARTIISLLKTIKWKK